MEGDSRGKLKIKAEKIAMSYVSYMERTSEQLRNQLLNKKVESEIAEEVVHEFQKAGFINDVTYGAHYIEYCHNKGRGDRRILLELKTKGLTQEDIEKAYDKYSEEACLYRSDFISLEDAQAKRLREQCEKMFNSMDNSDATMDKKIAKVGRRLAALGYSSSEIYRALGEILNELNQEV